MGVASWDDRRPNRFDLHGRPGLSSRSRFRGLLLTCRAIYSEAAALLYSANRFALYYSADDPDSLRPLAALTTPSLLSLSHLKIVLNEASCHQMSRDPEGCCLQRDYNPFDSHGRNRCQRSNGYPHRLHRQPLLAHVSESSDDETWRRPRRSWGSRRQLPPAYPWLVLDALRSPWSATLILNTLGRSRQPGAPSPRSAASRY